jgi:hypothetical protein
MSTSFFYTLQVGIHILIFFLANLTKGNMSFCHHLVSVVCHAFTFHILIFSSENLFGSYIVWLSSFKGEDFLEIDQSETRIACGGHICYLIGTK